MLLAFGGLKASPKDQPRILHVGFRRSTTSTRSPARSTGTRIDGLANPQPGQQVKGVPTTRAILGTALLPDGRCPNIRPALKGCATGYTNVQVLKIPTNSIPIVRPGYPLEKGS